MDRLAQVCERVAASPGRLKKVAAVSEYLRDLPDRDLARAVRFLSARPVDGGERKLSVGYSVLRDAALCATGWDAETYRICHRETGDTGETISLLAKNQPGAEPLTLEQADQLYQRVLNAGRTALKVEILAEAIRRHRPLTIKYFVKVITGNLRIGLQEKMVEEAVAAATGLPPAAVRAANNKLGDLARVALSARKGTLEEIEARLFHPMDFMLAQPVAALEEIENPGEWLVEDKYDGIRSQVHWSGGRVQIFSRGRDDVTQAFPELVEVFEGFPAAGIVDGEILAYRDNRAVNFSVFQQRLARKKVSASLRESVPVAFFGYDALYAGGRLLLELPIEARRAELESMLGAVGHPIYVSAVWTATRREEIDAYFQEARGRGNEGLLLKRRGSVYEPGRRSENWLKVKRPFGALDVVITAAEQGNGRRATMLSDYTFAVRDGERYLNVGKAYSGLTDPEIRQLTQLLKNLTTDRFGRVYLVKPEVVLEVAFDGVQKSPRHKSGYALRFPRILNWRRDKKPEECDTLDTVRELYEKAVEHNG
ncbi:MAG: ATP-dependent DNA ligase [Bryobacteraceae bacterium]|nr:ATP-dependent DNA ligase [Bryobacteraceae bacterium]